MNLLIRDQLAGPPSSVTTFRELTLLSHHQPFEDILIETDKTDFYYGFLKKRGALDFVSDFVPLNREDGIRLDIEHRYPLTVVADRIVIENLVGLVDRLRDIDKHWNSPSARA